MNIVIIGGVAAGAKVAAKSRRLLPDSEIDIYTQDTHVSYSACGLPYYIEDIIKDSKTLIVRTPADFEKENIKIKIMALLKNESLSPALEYDIAMKIIKHPNVQTNPILHSLKIYILSI